MVETYNTEDTYTIASAGGYFELKAIAPFDGFLIHLHVGCGGSSFYGAGAVNMGQQLHELFDKGSGDQGEIRWIGSYPVKQGQLVKIAGYSADAGKATGLFVFSEVGACGYIDTNAEDKWNTPVETITETDTSTGAHVQALKPVNAREIYHVWEPVEVRQVDDVGGAAKDVTIYLTDGTWDFLVETKAGLASGTWEQVDFSALANTVFPLVTSYYWYLEARVTHDSANDTISIRAPVQKVWR